MFTKTLDMSNKKWKLAYINQYTPRNKSKDLWDQGIHPLKDGRFLAKPPYFSVYKEILHSTYISDLSSFVLFLNFPLLLLVLYIRNQGTYENI